MSVIFCSKADALEMYGMEKPYYSFHLKGWHFIVLDGNSYRDEHGDLVDYNFGKYFETTDLPYLGDSSLCGFGKKFFLRQNPS